AGAELSRAHGAGRAALGAWGADSLHSPPPRSRRVPGPRVGATRPAGGSGRALSGSLPRHLVLAAGAVAGEAGGHAPRRQPPGAAGELQPGPLALLPAHRRPSGEAGLGAADRVRVLPRGAGPAPGPDALPVPGDRARRGRALPAAHAL